MSQAATSFCSIQKLFDHGPDEFWNPLQDAHKLTVQETPDSLKIEFPGAGHRMFVQVLLVVTFFGIGASLLYGPTLPPVLEFGGSLFVCLLAMGLLFYDRGSTRIEIDRQKMVISETGNLPLPAYRKTIPSDDIVQLVI